MTTKALQIRDAVVALMTATPVAGVAAAAVYKDWPFHLKPEDLPAVVVELGDEPVVQRALIGVLDRKLQVKVSIISKGTSATDATTLADPVVAEAHRRVVADLTLGNLAMDVTQDGGISRRRDVLEVPLLITELNYTVLYRTLNTSLEV